MQTSAISTVNLTKKYTVPGLKSKKTAVSSLNLNVECGSVFGFLGPNGAGKTSTIKMLLGFIEPTSGEAYLNGIPISDHVARTSVGYLPEQPYFPKFLTVYETVKMHGDLSGVPVNEMRKRTEECLERVDMIEHRKLPLNKCSKGMTQRVGIATSLIARPRLLILDEPSSGLDPVAKRNLRTLIGSLRADGMTLFISSHELSEMEPICDRVAVLSHGELIAEGRPLDLLQDSSLVRVCIASETPAFSDTELQSLAAIAQFDQRTLTSTIKLPNDRVLSLMNMLDRKNCTIQSVNPDKESLEEAFLRMVA